MGINSAFSGGYAASEALDIRAEWIDNAWDTARRSLIHIGNNPEAFNEQAVNALETLQKVEAEDAKTVKTGLAVAGAGAVTTAGALGSAPVNPLALPMFLVSGGVTVVSLFRAGMAELSRRDIVKDEARMMDDLLSRNHVGTGGQEFSSDIATKKLNIPKLKN
jgi:hypothetical protein